MPSWEEGSEESDESLVKESLLLPDISNMKIKLISKLFNTSSYLLSLIITVFFKIDYIVRWWWGIEEQMSGRELISDAKAQMRLGLRKTNMDSIDKSTKPSFSAKEKSDWGRTNSKG